MLTKLKFWKKINIKRANKTDIPLWKVWWYLLPKRYRGRIWDVYLNGRTKIFMIDSFIRNIPEGHLGGYARITNQRPRGDPWSWTPELWRWAYNELGIHSVLDVGCGLGHTINFFKGLGCEVLRIDGSKRAKKHSVIPECQIIHDFNNGPFMPPKTYDLVWSCEFLEHVEEKYVNNFLKTFSYSQKYIMLTHAVPGEEGGWHHVNCQPAEYWIKKLSIIQFKLDLHLTSIARNIASEGYFKRTGLVFVLETGKRI